MDRKNVQKINLEDMSKPSDTVSLKNGRIIRTIEGGNFSKINFTNLATGDGSKAPFWLGMGAFEKIFEKRRALIHLLREVIRKFFYIVAVIVFETLKILVTESEIQTCPFPEMSGRWNFHGTKETVRFLFSFRVLVFFTTSCEG